MIPLKRELDQLRSQASDKVSALFNPKPCRARLLEIAICIGNFPNAI